jgi:hypothetical protein
MPYKKLCCFLAVFRNQERDVLVLKELMEMEIGKNGGFKGKSLKKIESRVMNIQTTAISLRKIHGFLLILNRIDKGAGVEFPDVRILNDVLRDLRPWQQLGVRVGSPGPTHTRAYAPMTYRPLYRYHHTILTCFIHWGRRRRWKTHTILDEALDVHVLTAGV